MKSSNKALIDQAIQNKSKLIILFCVWGAGMRRDIIIPRRWTTTGELCAYSLESHGEIYIYAPNILKCDPYNLVCKDLPRKSLNHPNR